MTKNNFEKHKWITLMSFSFMYSLVYLARFNVNNLISDMSIDVEINVFQQDMIGMSVFFSYGIGSFINGYLADIIGSKRIIATGVFTSCIMNIIVVFQTEWLFILIIWLINGYFQSMIWVGGISMLANWWQEGERGKGIGIANFFSGLSHAVAYILPALIMTVTPFGWKGSFVIPIIMLAMLTAIFLLFSKKKPEDAGCLPYGLKETRHIDREEALKSIFESNRKVPIKHFISESKFIWWCLIAFTSSICRYGLLNWIPLYYENSEAKELLNETFSNITLPIGMAFGTLVITWLAGTKHFNNKGIIVTAMAAICGTLVIVFPMIDDPKAILVGIFLTGFVLYGINGILWVHAIDQGCRFYAGTVAGIFNGCAYLGAFAEGLIFPFILKCFDSYISIFVTMEILCLIMVVFGMAISKKNTVFEPEVRE